MIYCISLLLCYCPMLLLANQVRMTSPLKSMTHEQWKAPVTMLSSPKHKVWSYMLLNHL